ncbi:hypothetical protein ACHQM5_013627 [Ranunculus cassubicifolius]
MVCCRLFSELLIHINYLLLVTGIVVQRTESFGINYGQLGNNLPTPDRVLELLTSLRITKTRIYDTNPQILTAFAGSKNMELIVTVENEILGVLADPAQALQWVETRIKPYFPATKITEIAVGNEIFTGNDATQIANVVPVIINIHQALVQLGLDTYIKVSTASSLAVLLNSYPPSAGSFKPDLVQVIRPFLQFLNNTGAPFWINAYPYFAYKDDPKNISLDYALLNTNSPGMVDPYTNLHYDNMLYAMVDAVIVALYRLGYGGIEVRVSETGWPSNGDPNEVGATIANAQVYNRNLLRRQMHGEGTPLRPSQRLEIYLFALFNENMKPGQASERNYGLYEPDLSMTYNVGLNTLSSPATTTTTSSSTTSSSTTSASSVSLASSSTTLTKVIKSEP